MTQAALTKSLRKLEEDVGLALLLRTPHGVQLTDAGLRLHARASLIDRQLELLQSDLAEGGRGTTAMVRLLVTPLVAACGLVPALRGFRDHHPAAHLSGEGRRRFLAHSPAVRRVRRAEAIVGADGARGDELESPHP